jgi:hypothetical protein
LKPEQKRSEKKRVIELANKWFNLLNLYHWRILFTFKSKKEEEGVAYRPGELKVIDNAWEITMSTVVDPYYLVAKITVWLPVIKEMDDDELEETFLHECVHIMVSPISKPNKSKEEELVATTIARALKNTFDITNGNNNTDTRRSTRKRTTPNSVPTGE